VDFYAIDYSKSGYLCDLFGYICDRILENHPYGCKWHSKYLGLKAAFNIEFLSIYDCNKSLIPKITISICYCYEQCYTYLKNSIIVSGVTIWTIFQYLVTYCDLQHYDVVNFHDEDNGDHLAVIIALQEWHCCLHSYSMYLLCDSRLPLLLPMLLQASRWLSASIVEPPIQTYFWYYAVYLH